MTKSGQDTSGFGPLQGVRVIDLGTVIAAPYGTSLLADFGADVIKVELPGSGDGSRSLLPRVDDVSLRWTGLNRNKRCVTLDLRTEAGRAVFLKLVAKADMIVESFRPGTLDRWGLDYATLQAANPDIIVVRVSGYGQSGPYRERAGFGTPATAFSGVTGLMGFPDRPPTSPPFSLADYVAGMMAALAAVMALYQRDAGRASDGQGQEVDVSLYEPLFRMLEFMVGEFDQLGVVRERSPGLSGGSSPGGTFQTCDGTWVVLVTSTERTWQRLTHAIGHPELLDAPRFTTNADRVRHDAALTELLADWFVERTYAEATVILDEAGCPVSPIHTIRDIMDDPHYRERENIITVDHPTLGALQMPGIIPKFSRTPGRVNFPGPALGEHNDEVFRGLLGLSDAEIAAVTSDG